MFNSVTESFPRQKSRFFFCEQRRLRLRIQVRRSVCWVREVYNSVIPIADEQGAFSQLRSTIVNRIHFKTVHVIAAWELLQVIRKEPDHGAWFFIKFQEQTALFWPLGNFSMAKSGRQETTDIFHQKKSWLHVFNEPQKLP